jgi:hypothetical protein
MHFVSEADAAELIRCAQDFGYECLREQSSGFARIAYDVLREAA